LVKDSIRLSFSPDEVEEIKVVKNRPKVLVIIEGGDVQVRANPEEVELIFRDIDNAKVDEEEEEKFQIENPIPKEFLDLPLL
jgi:hypothetical protein